jgi:hypothetical protein
VSRQPDSRIIAENTSVAMQQKPCTERDCHLFSEDRCEHFGSEEAGTVRRREAVPAAFSNRPSFAMLPLCSIYRFDTKAIIFAT